jgi:DNA-binding MarR family transcriptional regulator
MAFDSHRLLRPHRLTLEQYDTLLILQRDEGWRMGDLTKKILSDNSKMTRIVDYLESKSLAERRPDPEDRRAQQVYLTDKGAALREEIKQVYQAALRKWLAPFSEDQKREMQLLIKQFRDHMQTQLEDNDD